MSVIFCDSPGTLIQVPIEHRARTGSNRKGWEKGRESQMFKAKLTEGHLDEVRGDLGQG